MNYLTPSKEIVLVDEEKDKSSKLKKEPFEWGHPDSTYYSEIPVLFVGSYEVRKF